jgi:ABC-type transport system involved in multi-copper enzyme maturation permease subunit
MVFRGSMRNVGPILFGILTYYAFGLSLLAGVFLASDCISEEKREGTLGLLFLTDLRGYDVVLGKLMAVGLSALYGLVAVLPVMALPLLMGGVTGGEYWRVALALANTLFFSLACGILVSTLSREAARAMGNTLGLLVIAAVGLPMLGRAFLIAGVPAGWSYFTAISPFQAFGMGRAAGYGFSLQYWISLISSHFFAWLLLLIASWRLPHVWQDKPVRQRTSPLGEIRSRASPALSQARRLRLLDENPILWLAAGGAGLRWRVWGITALSTAILGIMLAFDHEALTLAGGTYVLVVTDFFLKIFVAFQATRFFVEVRRNGALELILSTPLTSREIVRGQWLAMKQMFLWPVIILLGAQFMLFILSFGTASQMFKTINSGSTFSINGWQDFGSLADRLFQFGLVTYKMATALADLMALGWVGMWLGLSAKKPGMAAPMTVLFVVVIPMFAFCVPSLIIDLFFILWARNKLVDEFRPAALPPLHPVFAPIASCLKSSSR